MFFFNISVKEKLNLHEDIVSKKKILRNHRNFEQVHHIMLHSVDIMLLLHLQFIQLLEAIYSDMFSVIRNACLYLCYLLLTGMLMWGIYFCHCE